ncbi:hypothetical protein VTL71DRAFT_5678 [Oculimacula yallundae]|uniref:Ubiquitin-like protease family profile domain-containing protein n=1 Tax=Oculimacula yallundae TaxID=86028 RepID=A0ABR4BY55_9HELO
MHALQDTPDPDFESEIRKTIIYDEIEPTPLTNLYDIPPYPDPLHEIEEAEHPAAQLTPEPDMDAALKQQQHILNGMAIYEMAVNEHKEKTEADKLMDTIAKLEKCNEFVVQRMDISLEGEVLGARLQEGTNRKRAQTINFEYLNYHNRLLDLSNTQALEDLRTTRCRSEEIDTEVCARTRALQFLGDTATRLKEGHFGDDMSERSSGTKRRTRSSAPLKSDSPADHLKSTNTSATLEEVVGKPADNDEIVPIRGSSKRIPPDQGPKVVEEETKELEPAVSLETVLNALPTPNAHDQKAATASSEPSKRKPWPARDRYLDLGKSVFADYGPLASVQAPPKRADKEMPKPFPGGMKPMNRLGESPKQNPNPNSNFQRPALPKIFDLTSNGSHGRQYNENPAKRQRVDDGSSASPIDLEEDESPLQSRQIGPTSNKSGHSRTLQSHGTSAGVEARVSSSQEFRNVQHSMKPPSSRNRNGKPPVINGSHRFNRNVVGQYVGEDESDLISDDGSSTKNGTAGKSSKKTELQISGYQGSANRPPSRQLANGTNRLSARPRAETAKVSPHFGANGSRAEDSHEYLSQDDRDELSMGSPGDMEHANTARKLLKANHIANRVSPKSRKVHIDMEESSEDEFSKTGDIPPGKYVSSKSSSGQNRGDESYPVFQLLSEKVHWLLPDEPSPWSLELNTRERFLAVYNNSEQQVIGFPSREIEKIECDETGNKIVLHKSRTQTAARATKIYIEMHTHDDTLQLMESLKALDSTLVKMLKPRGHLKKVFITVAQQDIPPPKLRQEEPEDLRLIKSNAERKFADQCAAAQSSKQATTGTSGLSQQNGTLQRGTQAKGLAREMRRGSQSSEVLEVDDNRRTSNATALQPGDFYGASGDSRSSGGDHGTRSSKRFTSHEEVVPVSRQSQRQRMRSPSPEPERWTLQNPNWVEQENWEISVIYPPDGKDKASVDMQDIHRLDEGEFLNDNLVVFYLRWLEDHLVKNNPELASRIYFTNTFFYERLTKHGKGKSGGINYEAVQRWTSKIDLLKYDYIVVPINETVHWYVAIICNAPKLLKQPSSEEETSQDIENEDLEDKLGNVEVEAQPISSRLKTPAKSQSDVVVPTLEEMTLEDIANESPDLDVSGINPDATKAADARNTLQVVNLDSPTAVVSDVTEQRPLQSKKGKRKSLPTTRKYNPDDPRIITLDSLGLSHSPTCTNLRKYLIQEIKAKKNIEIKDPGPLGTTAKHIPQQNNHCDCGVFLLTYIEEFLSRPDEFICDILQRNDQDFTKWRSASDMRTHIRNLLFNLQREQVREAESSRREKAKSKQAVKAGDKSVSAASSKPASREASESITGSASPGKVQPTPDTNELYLEKSQKRQEVLLDPPELPQHFSVAAPSKGGPLKSNANEPDDREAQSTFNHALGLAESGLREAKSPEARASESQPITIDDSQDLDQEPQHAAAPASGRKDRKRKPSRPPPEDSRDSKLPRLKKSIEIPESPNRESAGKGSRITKSSGEIVLNHHPLPYSSQGEDQDEHQSVRLPNRPTSNGNGRRRRTKNTDTFGHEHNAPESNGLGASDIDASQNDVQLVEVRQTSLQDRSIASREEYDDEDEMLMSNTPPRRGPPPPDAPLLSSSPGDNFSVPEVAAKEQLQDSPVRFSPRNAKRRSSAAVVIESSSTKRRRSFIDLSIGSPNAKQRPSRVDPELRDVSDLAILGINAPPRAHNRSSFGSR